MPKPTYTTPILNTGWAHYASIHAACPLMNDSLAELGPGGASLALENTGGSTGWHTAGSGERGVRRTASVVGDRIRYTNFLPDLPDGVKKGTVIVIYRVDANAVASRFFANGTNFFIWRVNSSQDVQTRIRSTSNATGLTGLNSGRFMTTTSGQDKVIVLTWDASRRYFFQSGLTDGLGDPIDAYDATTGTAPGNLSHGSVSFLSDGDGDNAVLNTTILGFVSLNKTVTQAEAKAIIANPWDWVQETGGPPNQAPTFSGTISNLSGTAESAITPVDVSSLFSDPDLDTLTYSTVGTWPARDGGGSWVNATTGVISGTPAAGSNTGSPYTGLKIQASDGSLTVDSNTFTFTVNAASGTAPTITGVSGDIIHGQPLTITGTNLTGAAVTIGYSSVSVAQTETSGASSISIASVNSLALPYKTLTITATTGDGVATFSAAHVPPPGKAFTVVDVPWEAPSDSIFEGPPDTAAVDGDQIEYETASNRGVSVLVRPDGTLRVADGTFPHKFYVRVWDESGLDWGTEAQITVTPSDYRGSTPIWAGPNISDQIYEVGTSITLDGARFEDLEDDISTYALVGSWPFWASINPASGLITGTAVLGSWPNLTVQATDAFGNVGVSNTFSITVTAPPQGPVWNGPALSIVSYVAGDAVNINLGQFLDPDSSIAFYSVSGTLPPWAMFDTATGVISGVAEQGVWVGIRVTATDTSGLTGQSPEITIAVSDEPVDPGEPVPGTPIGRGQTLLSIVNSVLRRLREDTVTSLNDQYPCLIADFVSDIHKEVVESCDWTSMDHDVVVLVKAGRSDYVLYSGSDDIAEGSIPPNSRSVVRYNDDVPVAFLYESEEDMGNGKAVLRMNEVNEQGTRVDLWDRSSTVGVPDAFAVFTDRIEDGVVLKLNTVPDKDYLLKIRWHTPEAELSCDDDPERLVYAPSKPIILGAVFLALNERGEELGEPGALAERRYRSALASEIETDRMRQIKTNIFEMYRE